MMHNIYHTSGADMDPILHAIAVTHGADVVILPYWAMKGLGVRYFFADGQVPGETDLLDRVSPAGKEGQKRIVLVQSKGGGHFLGTKLPKGADRVSPTSLGCKRKRKPKVVADAVICCGSEKQPVAESVSRGSRPTSAAAARAKEASKRVSELHLRLQALGERPFKRSDVQAALGAKQACELELLERLLALPSSLSDPLWKPLKARSDEGIELYLRIRASYFSA